MEARQISILIYGRDARVQETRKWVLQSQGYRVLTITRLAELKNIPMVPNVSLLVLCHTLTAKEREDALYQATARWPKLKHLALGQKQSLDSEALIGEVMHRLDGPAGLLNMVSELVGHSASSPHSHIY